MALPFARLLLTATIALLPLASAYANDDEAFVATGDGTFGTIDLNSGVITPVGNTGDNLAGLGEVNGNLYATFLGGNLLYLVDPATGNLTSIGGTEGLEFEAFGSSNGKLYGISDTEGPRFYSVNSSDGTATDLGSFDATLGDWFQLSTGSPTLYFASDTSLYSVDTSNGSTQLLGDTGGADVGALVFENGTLYGGANGTFSPCGDCCDDCCGDCCSACAAALRAIDTTLPSVVSLNAGLATNNATQIANVSSGDLNAFFYALAPDLITATPEPAGNALMAGAMLMLGFWWRRRRAA
jgi:hypothetical protein